MTEPWWNTDEDNDEVATSPELWRPLADAVGGFDLDPAAGAESAPIAENRYTVEDDGLSQPWYGNVFLNPPGSEKLAWYSRLHAQYRCGNVDRAIALGWGHTSSGWFQDHFSTADAVCFLSDRNVFTGQGDNPSFAVWVGAWNPNRDVLEFLHDRGQVMFAVDVDRGQTEAAEYLEAEP